MQVTNLRVSFLREKQPVQYEKAQPAVEFIAVLEDGEDHVAAARRLMMEAATVVYAGIGYSVPDKVAAALVSGEIPAGGTIVAEKVEAAAPEAPAETPEEEPAAPKKRGRGRPKGSKNTAPKAGSKAAQEAAAAAQEANEVPGDEVPNISTGGERIDPDAIPGDDENPPSSVGSAEVPEPQTAGVPSAEQDQTAKFTAKDLHTLMNDSIKAGKLSVVNAKSVLQKFKVARAQDLTPEQAIEGKNMIELMIKAAA